MNTRVTCAVVAFTLLLVTRAAGQDVTIRFTAALVPESAGARAMEAFRLDAARLSSGAIKVETVPAMEVGSLRDVLDQAKSGRLQAAVLPTGVIAGVAPRLAVLNLPFLFKDREAAFRALDGPPGQELERELDRAGLKGLGFWERGWRHVTNSKRPITTPADLSGLRIRIPNDTFPLRTFKLIGARPVPMDINAVQAAMRQGTVDGQESSACATLELGFHQVQKFLSTSGHFYDLDAVVVNKRVWDGLGERQGWITQAARKATELQRTRAAEDETKCLDDLRQKGVETNPVPPETLGRLRQMTQPIYRESEPELGRALLGRFMDANR